MIKLLKVPRWASSRHNFTQISAESRYVVVSLPVSVFQQPSVNKNTRKQAAFSLSLNNWIVSEGKRPLCNTSRGGSARSRINIQFCFLQMWRCLQTNPQESLDVSAAVMEIKMSVICSCRASGERHKQSAERGRAKLLSVCLEGADNSRRLKLIQPGPTRPDPKQDAR